MVHKQRNLIVSFCEFSLLSEKQALLHVRGTMVRGLCNIIAF